MATTMSPYDPSTADPADLLRDLGTDAERGLTGQEAARRLAEDGPNELRAKPPVPLWRKVVDQFRDPLVYLLLVAMAISLVAWWVEGAAGIPVDVVVIGAIVLANAVIGLVQELRAEDAVAALASMTAVSSTVIRDGLPVTVPSRELVRGDLLALAEGDSVGADARLLHAAALRVQEASLTGESEASDKSAETLAGPAPLGDRTDMVFKGTAVAQGVGRAVVVATGMDTEMGAVATLLDETEQTPSPLQVEIAQVSRALGIIVIGIAVVVMVTLAVVNRVDSTDALVDILLVGVSLAVAAVPEGLPAILSLVLAIGVRAMAGRHAVMKELHSVETLGSASVICSDKTGTLTRNEMTLARIVTSSGEIALSGTGYGPDGTAEVVSRRHDADADDVVVEARRLLVGGTRANNAQVRQDEDGTWAVHGDPTEAAFLVAARKLPGVTERAGTYAREAELPFSSERKRMSTVDRRESGERRLFAKGAPDVLLERCTRVRVVDETAPLDDVRRGEALADVERLSGEAFRTLGVASRDATEADLVLDEEHEHDLTWVGVVGIIDPPREEAAVAVADAHRAGIRVIMITGDHPATAARIAADLGIVEPGARVLTGTDLDDLDDAGWAAAVHEVSVFARVSPQHKLRIVDALQDEGQIVSMTGDGVNDAPALKSADIGVAMGITGTEVTKEAATMILGDDNFATIVAAVRQGRVIFDNIAKFLRYLLSSNMGEVATVFFGIVLAGVIGLDQASHLGDGAGQLVLPLLATQILWINLVTDSGPALAMGVDPEIDDVMARRPRRAGDRILDRATWVRIVLLGLVMAAASLLALDTVLPGGLVPGDLVPGGHGLDEARTAAFTTLVFAQLFNAFNARSVLSSACHRLFVNRWLWAAVVLAAVLQVLVTELPVLQTAFGTASLSPAQWGLCAGLASVVLWVEEAAKVVRRARVGAAT